MQQETTEAPPSGRQSPIPRPHLLKAPVSKLCDEIGLTPKVPHRWRKDYFQIADNTGITPSETHSNP